MMCIKTHDICKSFMPLKSQIINFDEKLRKLLSVEYFKIAIIRNPNN